MSRLLTVSIGNVSRVCPVTKLKAKELNLLAARVLHVDSTIRIPCWWWSLNGRCLNGRTRKVEKIWNENVYLTTNLHVCFLNHILYDITINHSPQKKAKLSYELERKLDEWKLKIRFFFNPQQWELSTNFTHFKQFIHVTFLAFFSLHSTSFPHSLMCHFAVEMIYDFSFKLDYIHPRQHDVYVPSKIRLKIS